MMLKMRTITKIAFLLLLAVSIGFPVMPGKAAAVAAGTANGTYDFGGTLGPASGGYKLTGDKFLVSSGAEKRGTSLWAANQTAANTMGSFVIRAEWTNVNRTFTFKDLGISATSSGKKLKYFSVTLHGPVGNQITVIDNYTYGGGAPLSLTTATAQLSRLLNGGKTFTYNNVSVMTILWEFADGSPPSNLNFNNITIANVQGGYPLSYNGNGNTGGSVPSGTVYYGSGNSVTVQGGGTLAKTGYTFAGWNTKADGTGTNYAAGARLTMSASNVTLYAVWTPATYKIAYNGNGATSGGVPIDNGSYVSGVAATVLGSGTLARSGYTFAGWNTKADGTGTNYAAGAKLTMGASNVTLYAKWTLIPTYKITYNGNGATSGGVPADNGSYVSGVAATVMGSGTLARSGYTFAGWNTKADGTGTNYAAGAALTIGATNVTLYAKWTLIPTYKITYNGNGSTSGGVPTDNGNYVSGASATVLGSGTLTRSGYTFAGWNTKADGTGTNYAAGAALTMGAANVTLYAKWTLVPTYKITYNGNGSTGGGVPADNGSYVSGASATVLESGTLVRSGYTFAGWNTKADGTGTTYAAGTTLTMGATNVTLYAKWTLVPTYKITYNGNGSTGGGVPADNGNYVSGASATVLGSGTLARSGYTFAGWNTKADGTGTNYAAGAALTMGASNMTLYAQWTPIPTYTIAYDGNGAESGSEPTDNGNYVSGAKATVLGSGTLARSGYTFVGWNTEADGSGASYTAGAMLTIGAADVELYAQWTLIPTYTIAYDGNGFTGGGEPVDGNRYVPGATATILGGGTLVYAGYTFAGWNTMADGTGTNYSPGAALTMAAENVTLYAQWALAANYSITYYGNGSMGGSEPADSNAYMPGDSATVLDSGTLARDGYAFAGWNTEADGTGTNYAAGSMLTIGAADVKLYAQWTPVPTYTITYKGNGATSGIEPTDNNRYESGDPATVSGAGTLDNAGYAFAGWNTEADGSGTRYAAGSTLTMRTEDVELYAQWTLVPTYTITYNANGATSGSAPSDGGNYEPGDAATVLDAGTLDNAGYTFTGWNTEADGSGTRYTIGSTLTMGAEDVELYAQWTMVPTYTITYNANGATSGSAPSDGGNYEPGDAATVLDAGTLDNAGYTFTGWNTEADGSGTRYTIGSTLTMGTEDVELYAEWTLVPTYTIAYNGNGATSGGNPFDGNHYMSGDSATVLDAGTLDNAGYTFVGWNTEADGGGTRYTVGSTLTIGAEDVELYAQWTQVPTYTITYNRNGATDGVDPSDSNNYVTGASATVLGSGTLERNGFTFAGWNTDANGNGTAYAAGAALTIGTDDVALYAQWTLEPVYTITYKDNGASRGSAPIDSNNYLPGESAMVLGSGTLAKDGHTFAEWNTAADGSGTRYPAGSTLAMGAEDAELYAQWTIMPSEPQSNGSDNGSGASEPMVILRSAVVLAGDDSSLKELIPIERKSRMDGKKLDRVVLDPITASNIMRKAAENNKDAIRILINDLPGDPADQVSVTIAKHALERMKRKAGLEIETADITIAISKEVFSTLPDVEQGLNVFPIHQDLEQKNVLQRILQSAVVKQQIGDKDVQLVGKPIAIETGIRNRQASMLFPLQAAMLPADPAELSSFLATLSIYAENAEGEAELLSGQIQYDKSGEPSGIVVEHEMDEAGTFALLSLKAKQHLPYMTGFPDRTFRPDDTLTRAEVATILYRFMREERTQAATGSSSFPDIQSDHWAAAAVAAVSGEGLMAGDANGMFRPDAKVSRAEMATIVAKWKRLSTSGKKAPFLDTEGSEANASIAAAAEKGYMIGVGGGLFLPDQALTRAQAVTLFNRLTGRGFLTGITEQTWPDVPMSHWAFFDIAEATIPHTVNRQTDGTERFADQTEK